MPQQAKNPKNKPAQPLTEERRNQLERRGFPRKNVSAIVKDMRDYADENFDGDLVNNISHAFNSLSEGERRTFLRYSLSLITESKLKENEAVGQCIIPTDFDHINTLQIVEELSGIEKSTQIENLKLRNWFLKIGFIAIIISCILYVGYILYITQDNQNSSGFIKNFLELLLSALEQL